MDPSRTDLKINAPLSQNASYSPGPLSATFWPSGRRGSMHPAEAESKIDSRSNSPMQSSPLPEEYENLSNTLEIDANAIKQAYSDVEKFQVLCEEAHENTTPADKNSSLKAQRERKSGLIYTYFSNKEKYNVQDLPEFFKQNFSDEERLRLSISAREGINILEKAVKNDSESVKDNIKNIKENIKSIKSEIYGLIENENSPLSAKTKKQLFKLVNDAIRLGGLALAVSICLCFPLCFSHSPGAWIPGVQAIADAALKGKENEEDIESTASEEDRYENYKDQLKKLAEQHDALTEELNEYEQKLLSVDAVKSQLIHIYNQCEFNDSEQINSSLANRRFSQSSTIHKRHSLTPLRIKNRGGDNSQASPTDVRRWLPATPQRGFSHPSSRKNSLPEGLGMNFQLGSPFSSPVPAVHTEQLEEHSVLQNIDVLQENLAKLFEKDLSVLKIKITKNLEECLNNSPALIDDLLGKQKKPFERYQENFNSIKAEFSSLQDALKVDASNVELDVNSPDSNAEIVVKSIPQFNALLNQYKAINEIINKSIDNSIGLAYRFIAVFIKAMRESLEEYALKIQEIIDSKKNLIIIEKLSRLFKDEVITKYALLGHILIKDSKEYVKSNKNKLELNLEINNPINPLLLSQKCSETIELIGEFDKNINIKISVLKRFEEKFINPLRKEISDSIDAIDKQAVIYFNENIKLAEVAEVAEVHSEEEVAA